MMKRVKQILTLAASQARITLLRGTLLSVGLFLLSGSFAASVEVEIDFSFVEFKETTKEQVEKKSKAPTETALEGIERQLRQSGIEPTLDGAREYLKSFASTEEGARLTRELVAQLGAPDYERRETASKKLSSLPTISLDILKESARSTDPEVAWRSRLLLQRTEEIHRENYSAVLRLISTKKLVGLTSELLFVLEKMNSPEKFKRDVFVALEATTTPTDLKQLESSFANGTGFLQESCVFAMRKIASESYQDRFMAMSAKAGITDQTKLQAAYGLADLEDRRCLKLLGDLLSSDDVVVRVRSNSALSAMTQKNIRFVAYGDEKQRKTKTKEWRDWLADNGDNVKLHLPLDDFLKQRSFLNGNTLIALGYKNRVVELDASRKVVWEYETQAPWSAEKLENGNVLIAGYRENKVFEVSMDKKIVWEFEASNALNARALENGNVLICLYSGTTVQEVNRNKEVVWEYKAKSSVADAIRLPNGNTILATNDSVSEVNPEGKIVWERTEAKQAYGVNITPEGTLLISQLSGSVVEVDRSTNKIVWEFATSNPVDAFRLEDGNTLITTGTETLEVDPDGKSVWKFPGANYGTARR